MHFSLIVYASFLVTITSIVQVIAGVLNALINATNSIIASINNLLGTSLNQISASNSNLAQSVNELKESTDRMIDRVIGCGRKHPSPLMRDYVNNVCGKCGLTFKSSILNDANSDYFNAAYLNAPVDKGVKESDTSTFWVESNSPIRSGEQFLDELCDLFNAKWEVKNSILALERRDANISSTPFINTNLLDSDKFSICYSWSKKSRPAYGTFEYQRDAINTVGIEAIRRWGDVVEWNLPPLPNQKGEYKPLFNFAAARFRKDNVRLSDGPDKDVFTLFENVPLIGPYVRKFENALLLNEHKCMLPIALIWDGKSLDSATVDPNQFIPAQTDPNFTAFANNSKATPPGEYYNYPFWFDSKMPNNMYDRFWSIENPRSSGFQGKVYELTVELTCANLNAADLDGTVQASEGIGHVDVIEFNYANKTMTITGEI